MSFLNKRGITLAVTVMLIVFTSIAVSGITIFIVQRLTQIEMKQFNARTLYLAQSGVHNAIYNYRFEDLTGDGYFSLGQTNIDVNNYFVVGGTAADMLMVDARSTAQGVVDPNCYAQCAASLVACEAACQASCGGSTQCVKKCERDCRSANRDCENLCDDFATSGAETLFGLQVKNATDSKTI